jgi:hypothetical protein
MMGTENKYKCIYSGGNEEKEGGIKVEGQPTT